MKQQRIYQHVHGCLGQKKLVYSPQAKTDRKSISKNSFLKTVTVKPSMLKEQNGFCHPRLHPCKLKLQPTF